MCPWSGKARCRGVNGRRVSIATQSDFLELFYHNQFRNKAQKSSPFVTYPQIFRTPRFGVIVKIVVTSITSSGCSPPPPSCLSTPHRQVWTRSNSSIPMAWSQTDSRSVAINFCCWLLNLCIPMITMATPERGLNQWACWQVADDYTHSREWQKKISYCSTGVLLAVHSMSRSYC